MQRVQRQMDEIILDTDFNAIDWSRWGMPPLPKPVTPELKQHLQVDPARPVLHLGHAG